MNSRMPKKKAQTIPMVIVVGPSGVGKSTFVEKITQERPGIRDIITFTTRPMRAGESTGNPYNFVKEAEFRALMEKDFFVEWAEVHGKLYGTPRDQIDDAIRQKHAVIMDVDIQGARTFQEKYPGCLTLFIHPPSIPELRERILKRESKLPNDIEIRLKNAEIEIKSAHEFDCELTNDNFEVSYSQFKKIIDDFLKNA